MEVLPEGRVFRVACSFPTGDQADRDSSAKRPGEPVLRRDAFERVHDEERDDVHETARDNVEQEEVH
eukprot:10863425-Heterocapsa_arctica.AAC.1